MLTLLSMLAVGLMIGGAVDINEALKTSQAQTLDGMGKMFALTGDRQSSVFLKKADEPDILETTAMRQVMYRDAPITEAK